MMTHQKHKLFISSSYGKQLIFILSLVTFFEASFLPLTVEARQGRTGSAREMSADELNGLWQQYNNERPEVSFTEYCQQNNPTRTNQQDLSRTSNYIVRDLERQASQPREQQQRPVSVGIGAPVMGPIPVPAVTPQVDENLRQMIANYQTAPQVQRMLRMAEGVRASRSSGRCVRGAKALLGSSGVSRDLPGDGTVRSWDMERSLRNQGFINIANAQGANGQRAFRTPADAPEGAVLIYYNPSLPLNARYQRGHVEIKTSRGGVSDFRRSFGSGDGSMSRNWQLVGVYIRDFGTSTPSATLASR